MSWIQYSPGLAGNTIQFSCQYDNILTAFSKKLYPICRHNALALKLARGMLKFNWLKTSVIQKLVSTLYRKARAFIVLHISSHHQRNIGPHVGLVPWMYLFLSGSDHPFQFGDLFFIIVNIEDLHMCLN